MSETFAGSAVVRYALPWVLERQEPGTHVPRYLSVINGRLAWTRHVELAQRWADQISAGGMLSVLRDPAFFGVHLNGTEKPAEMAA